MICCVNLGFQAIKFFNLLYTHAKAQVPTGQFHIYLAIFGPPSKPSLLDSLWDLSSTFLSSVLFYPYFIVVVDSEQQKTDTTRQDPVFVKLGFEFLLKWYKYYVGHFLGLTFHMLWESLLFCD